MEGRVIEYKRELTKDVEGLEKEVVSFLNTFGGELVFGLANDGTIYGVPDPDDIQKRIAQRLSENVHPSCLGLFDIEVEAAEGGKHLVKVTVSAGSDRPYYIAKYGMSSKGCYYRVGSSCRPIPERMIREMYAKRVPTTLATIVSPSQNLEFEQLKIYYSEKKHPLNDNFAETLDFLTPDGKYNFVAYLMADNNHLTFKFARYAGTDKCELIESSEYGFNCLITTAHRLADRLLVENRTWTKITPKLRLERKMFEPIPAREALINMLVHNDYSRGYTPVVEVYSDRLELTSHGGLPDGMTEERFFSGVSRPRNREIMRIFHDVEMVEQLGSGMNRILRYYDRSIFEIHDDIIKVVFRFVPGFEDDLQSKNEEFAGLQFNLQSKSDSVEDLQFSLQSNLQSKSNSGLKNGEKLSRAEIKIRIVKALKEDPSCTYGTLSKMFNISRSSIATYLKSLSDAGVVKRVGSDKDGHWEVL